MDLNCLPIYRKLYFYIDTIFETFTERKLKNFLFFQM